MLKPIAMTLVSSLLFVSNAHAIRGVVCDDGNVSSVDDFVAEDACADECTKPRCGGVLMYCYNACMDREENARELLPSTWQLAFATARAYVHSYGEPMSRKEAKDIAEATVYAKLNEAQDAHACATGAPSRNGLGWEDYHGGIFGQENPYPGTPGVWIRHTNPLLPGACWYPGPKSFVLTGNTLSTMDLAAQDAVYMPATPSTPYVWHPTPNRPDGQPSIDPCTTSPSLCSPNPHPLPPDPTIDECFWTGYCTDF